MPGRGTLEKDKPPVLGLIQRGGQVVLQMLPNVQQATIKPVITHAVAPGALFIPMNTTSMPDFQPGVTGHKTVCHAHGEYARDEDGDGFCEVHVNTIEGFWSLLRSWLRPHRGISQDKLPLYLGFFQFVHNTAAAAPCAADPEAHGTTAVCRYAQRTCRRQPSGLVGGGRPCVPTIVVLRRPGVRLHSKHQETAVR